MEDMDKDEYIPIIREKVNKKWITNGGSGGMRTGVNGIPSGVRRTPWLANGIIQDI
jgi:hypothetical protein